MIASFSEQFESAENLIDSLVRCWTSTQGGKTENKPLFRLQNVKMSSRNHFKSTKFWINTQVFLQMGTSASHNNKTFTAQNKSHKKAPKTFASVLIRVDERFNFRAYLFE